MRDILEIWQVFDKWWEDGGDTPAEEAAPVMEFDHPEEEPPRFEEPQPNATGFLPGEPTFAGQSGPTTGVGGWTQADIDKFARSGSGPGPGSMAAPQPSIDQIQAENDTLNGNAPEPYDPVFGSFSRGEVKDALVSYGWDPGKAETFANKFTVEVDKSPDAQTRGGGFWPGEGRVTYTPFDQGPEARAPFTFEHEMHHAADYTGWERDASTAPRYTSPTGPGAGSFREQNIAMTQQRDLTRLAEDPNYPDAAAVAQGLLDDPKIMADRAHINHYLIDRLDFDYAKLPPDFAHKYFPYAGAGGVPAARVQEIAGRNNDTYNHLEDNRMVHKDADTQAADDAYWDNQIKKIPWWGDINGPADFAEVGPPPIAGPYDKGGDESFYDENGQLTAYGLAMMGVR